MQGKHYDISGPLRRGASFRVGIFTPGQEIDEGMVRDLIRVLELTANCLADARPGDDELESWLGDGGGR